MFITPIYLCAVLFTCVLYFQVLKEASASERSAKSRCSDLEHQVSYLELDKKYLNNEVSKANLRAERAEEQKEHVMNKMRLFFHVELLCLSLYLPLFYLFYSLFICM